MLRIIFRQRQTRLFILVIIVSIVLFNFISSAGFLLGYYYASLFPIIGVPLILSNQSLNYSLQTHLYISVRTPNNSVIARRILFYDELIAILYDILIIITCTVFMMYQNMFDLSMAIETSFLLFSWSMFFTCCKNLLYLLLQNYRVANSIMLITSIIFRLIDFETSAVFQNIIPAVSGLIFSIIITAGIFLIPIKDLAMEDNRYEK